MRIALISAMEMEASGGDAPIAFAQYGVQTLALHQLEQALKLGCEKIILFCHNISPEILALQHAAEKHDARFHAISGPRPLSGLVSAKDEIFVLADGLLADSNALKELLGERPGVTILPAAKAVPAGFERIDGEHAWAGAMLLRGSMVEQLASLPPDIDPVSALLRIGLQGGTRMVPLPDIQDSSSDWILAREPEQLQLAGEKVMQSRLQPSNWFAPLRAIADRFAGMIGLSLFSKGIYASIIGAGGVFFALLALAFGWFFGAGAGFSTLSLAAFVVMVAQALERLAGKGAVALPIGWLVDFAILSLPFVPLTAQGWQQPIFASFMLLAWLHLAQRGRFGNWSIAAGDRAVLCILLSVAGFAGILPLSLQALAMLAAALTFFCQARSTITAA